jgi:hypothetical protein
MVKSHPHFEGKAADSPVAWFVVLERAKQDRDFKRAAEALHQLERLGVAVKYRKPREARHE